MSRNFSAVLWNHVHSITGFRREELQSLRETGDASSSDKDLLETLDLVETEWTDHSTILTIRSELERYLTTLRDLKAENAKAKNAKDCGEIRVKSFVENKRYTTLRQREVEERVTTTRIVGHFSTLRLREKQISHLDSSICDFRNVKELVLSRNDIQSVEYLPPNCRACSLAMNRIERIRLHCSSHQHLLFLGLANNRLESCEFLQEFPSLTVCDLSLNNLFDLSSVPVAIVNHPSLREVCCLGNPITFLAAYREIMVTKCRNLQILDDVPVTESEFHASEQKLANCEWSKTTVRIKFQIMEIRNVQTTFAWASKAVDQPPDENAQKNTKKPPAKKGAKDEQTGTVDKVGKKLVFSLRGDLAGHRLEVPDLDATAEHDANPQAPKPVASKAPPPKKGSAVAPAIESIAPPSEMAKWSFSWTHEVGPTSAQQMAIPCHLNLFVTEAELADGSPTAAVSVGHFPITWSQVLFDRDGAKTQGFTFTSSFVPDEAQLFLKKDELRRWHETLQALVEKDKEAERHLAKLKTPTPPLEEVSKPGSKKPPGKAPVKPEAGKNQKSDQASDEVMALREEISQRKAEMDEVSQMISTNERIIQRILKAAEPGAVQIVVKMYLGELLVLPQLEPDEKQLPVEPAPAHKGKKK